MIEGCLKMRTVYTTPNGHFTNMKMMMKRWIWTDSGLENCGVFLEQNGSAFSMESQNIVKACTNSKQMVCLLVS